MFFEAALALPARDAKPRRAGRTMMIDGGLPTRHFTDVIESFGEVIDVVKFGWGTGLVTRDLPDKIAVARANGVEFYFGGTLFELFVARGAFESWRSFCDDHGARFVEISNGTIDLSNSAKADYIAQVADQYTVYSEVGYKDSDRSEAMYPGIWVRDIKEDLAAGATTVITEARESGRSGICRPDGEPRYGLIEEILASDIAVGSLMFEAPTKELQTYLIKRVGSDVNLGNIASGDVLPLETLRLGLRSDTLNELETTHARTA